MEEMLSIDYITMLQKLKEQHGNTQRFHIFERNLLRDGFKVLPWVE